MWHLVLPKIAVRLGDNSNALDEPRCISPVERLRSVGDGDGMGTAATFSLANVGKESSVLSPSCWR